jgi:hypothetical protein
MKIIWRAMRWGALIVLLVLLGGTIYFGSIESYIYLTRSESKAQAAAQMMFLKICESNDLSPSSFHGPGRPSIDLDKKRNQYSFIWTRGPKETIYVNVSYLPYDFATSVSEAIIERKHEAGSAP